MLKAIDQCCVCGAVVFEGSACEECQRLDVDEAQTELVPVARVTCPHCEGDVDDGTHEVYCSREEQGARVPEYLRDRITSARGRVQQLNRMMQSLVQRQGVFPAFSMFADAMLKELETLDDDLKLP